MLRRGGRRHPRDLHARWCRLLPAGAPVPLSTRDADALARRLARETARRKEAERIAERVTRELYDRAEALAAATAGARRLLADALEAEDRERRRLARELHDTTLQVLLAAAQDLEEAQAGGEEALARGRAGLTDAVVAMREALRDIHPPALDHVGLAGALSGLAAQERRRGTIPTTYVRVEEAATETEHDELLVVLARELVRNVARHSGAEELMLELRRGAADVTLVVADDGCGIAPGRLEAALADGHLGIASSFERAAAAGGRMTVAANDPGARVEIVLPLAVDEHSAPSALGYPS